MKLRRSNERYCSLQSAVQPPELASSGTTSHCATAGHKGLIGLRPQVLVGMDQWIRVLLSCVEYEDLQRVFCVFRVI